MKKILRWIATHQVGIMPEVRKKLLGGDACPDCECKTIIRDEDTGEIVCRGCGLVIKESLLNMGPEWRAFTKSEKELRDRVGAPLSLSVHDKGLSTIISRINRDAHGVKIPLKTKLQMLRLKKWQARSRIHSSNDRNLSQAMSELDRLADKLHLNPMVREEAALLYRKSLGRGLVRGRSISSIVAASLYAACRMTKTQRTLREIAKQTPIDLKEISRCYRLLLRELKLQMPVPTAQLNVPKIAASADIGERTQRTAVEILRKAEHLRMTAGKDPMGLAAAALYIASRMNDEKLTQKTIADAAGITEVTIRNRYKGLKENLKIEI
jgi:transcription initiation factor TFIIB